MRSLSSPLSGIFRALAHRHGIIVSSQKFALSSAWWNKRSSLTTHLTMRSLHKHPVRFTLFMPRCTGQLSTHPVALQFCRRNELERGSCGFLFNTSSQSLTVQRLHVDAVMGNRPRQHLTEPVCATVSERNGGRTSRHKSATKTDGLLARLSARVVVVVCIR